MKCYADLDNGLYFGSWHSTNHKILEELKINDVFYITIDPTPQKDNVNYHDIYFEDNIQNADKLFYEILPNLLEEINNLITNQKKVLICCSMGRSRSATIATSYLMKYNNMNLDEALTFIKERRNININNGFMDKLKEFNKRLKKK